MHSSVYVTGVRLSHRSTAASGFAAEHPGGRRHQSIATGMLQVRRHSAANVGSVVVRADEDILHVQMA